VIPHCFPCHDGWKIFIKLARANETWRRRWTADAARTGPEVQLFLHGRRWCQEIVKCSRSKNASLHPSSMKSAPECEIDFAEPIFEVPLVNRPTFHLLALSICCGLACIANILSIWLILQQAVHHPRPREQRHIIRILALVPIYTLTTFLSLVFYKKAVYADVIRALYESFAVASLFSLLCNYVAPDLHKTEALHNMPLRNWTIPLNWLQKITGGERKGLLRKPKSSWTWFNVSFRGI
jgi:hypothetical protein